MGCTTDEIDGLVHSLAINNNAYPSPLNYRGFPKSVCTSVNNVACHGIPDDRCLENGDIINVDVTVSFIVIKILLFSSGAYTVPESITYQASIVISWAERMTIYSM